METQPLVSIMPWTFITTICNLLILTWAIKKFLFQPVKDVLAKRAREVDDTYSAAETAKNDALQMQAEYTQHLADAKKEAGEIVRAAGETANARAEQVLNEARQEAAALKTKAARDIELERQKAAGELKKEISSLAMELAETVVQHEISPDAHQQLVEEFISSIGDEQ